MRAATFFALTVGSWLAACTTGGAQESPFRHLPDNTMAVVHVRLEPLLKSDWGKAALKEVQSDEGVKEGFARLKRDTGIDLADIDSVTFLLLDPVFADEKGSTVPFLRQQRWNAPRFSPQLVAPPNAPRFEPVSSMTQGGPDTDYLPIVIVTMRQAVDRKQLMRKAAAADAGHLRQGLLFLNDRTVVTGPDHSVTLFAAHTTDKESELGRQLANEAGEPMIKGGYRLTKQLKNLLATESGGMIPVSFVFPLANAAYGTFAIDFAKSAEMKVRVATANDRQANLTAESVRTLLALGETATERSVSELEKSIANAGDEESRREMKEALAFAKAVRKMSADARVEQRQTEVSVSLQFELNPRLISSLLQMLVRPRVTVATH